MSVSNVFQVLDTFAGNTRYFHELNDAEKYRKQVLEELHTKYCINRWTPERCMCTDGGEMCASHHYAATVDAHSLDDCPMIDDVGICNITIE